MVLYIDFAALRLWFHNSIDQILLSSDAWMHVRNEVAAKSAGLARLKSGQDIELFECGV
jgi:hypothetical protein